MKFKDGAGIPKDTMGEFPLPFNTEPQYISNKEQIQTFHSHCAWQFGDNFLFQKRKLMIPSQK